MPRQPRGTPNIDRHGSFPALHQTQNPLNYQNLCPRTTHTPQKDNNADDIQGGGDKVELLQKFKHTEIWQAEDSILQDSMGSFI